MKGVEIARYELLHGCELAIHSDDKAEKIEGIPTQRACVRNARPVDFARKRGQSAACGLHSRGCHQHSGHSPGRSGRRHAHELFSRQDAKKVLDRVAEDNPKLVEDLVPKLLSLAVVQKVLQNLLRERVSIRDAVSILEALGEAAPITKNTVLLTEYVRQAIRRQIMKPLVDPSGDLQALFPRAVHRAGDRIGCRTHREFQPLESLAGARARHPRASQEVLQSAGFAGRAAHQFRCALLCPANRRKYHS